MPSYKRACKWKTKTLIRIYASVSCILFDKPYHLSKESFTLAPSLALSPLPHRGNGVTELGFHLISMEKFDLNETTFLHDYMSVCKSHSPSTLKKKSVLIRFYAYASFLGFCWYFWVSQKVSHLTPYHTFERSFSLIRFGFFVRKWVNTFTLSP